mmetsp:Transcript_3665/g.5090  ORF Transcript_3665/g.5090 Transcript_3665/m.5090 type:complete len:313 (-) Transcript_3665:26-964(-)
MEDFLANTKTIIVDGIHTDLCELYPQNKTKHSHIVIVVVPGNPGVVDFYIEFIHHLYEKLSKRISIVAVGHAGHGARSLNGSKVFTLEDQIKHKGEFLKSYFEPNTKFILMGHSVGSYICLKTYIRYHTTVDIIQIMNLFPTFRHLWEGMAPFVKVAIQPGVRQALCSMIHYTPWWLVKHGLAMKGDLKPLHHHIINKTLDYFVILNVLTMAHIESVDIREIDAEVQDVIQNHMEKLVFLYGPNDKYAPAKYHTELIESFPGVKAHLADEDIEHAFVMNHADRVAHQIIDWLHQAVKDHVISQQEAQEALTQ